jgi:Ca2+-binding RTX toxin-like protein
MVRPLAAGLTVAGLLAFAAPSAHAVTTVGIALASGANAGEAVQVRGDGRANDLTIAVTRVRTKTGRSTRFEIADRRGRVRVKRMRPFWGCHTTDRHTVVCSSAPTSYAYVFLGAGDDRLKVTTSAGVGPAATTVAVPDGLAGIPQDEGSEGSFLGWRIEGGPGRDRISGSPFFDHIIGGPGSDILDGRRGADRFDEGGEPGQDRVIGGSAHDTLVWTAGTPLNVDLRSGRFSGGTVSSIEKVVGGAGNDVLIGSDAAELLQGAGGADAIAGLGGPDLLIGDGVFTLAPGADAIDGGAGDDLLDVSNRKFEPFAPAIARTALGPPDGLSCGDGNDRVDTLGSQLVPANCEGARLFGATATVPLRPTALPGGALVFDVPCPAGKYFDRAVGRCDGTLTLTRSSDGAMLGSSPFSMAGGARAAVTVTPATAVASGQVVGVQIKGAFDGAASAAPPSLGVQPDIDQFDVGWSLAL